MSMGRSDATHSLMSTEMQQNSIEEKEDLGREERSEHSCAVVANF